MPLPALIQKLVREKAGCFQYNSSANSSNMNKENKNSKGEIERSKTERSENAKVSYFSVASSRPRVFLRPLQMSLDVSKCLQCPKLFLNFIIPAKNFNRKGPPSSMF